MKLQAIHCLPLRIFHPFKKVSALCYSDRVRTLPFPFRLIRMFLQSGVNLLLLSVFFPCHFLSVQPRLSKRAHGCMDKSACIEYVCTGFWYISCIVTLFKETGQNSVLSSSRFSIPLKVWRTFLETWPLFGFVCKTLQRQLLRGKRQQRQLLKFGKNEAWGLGCSNIAVLRRPWYDCTWEQAVLCSDSFPESKSITITENTKVLKGLEEISSICEIQRANMTPLHFKMESWPIAYCTHLTIGQNDQQPSVFWVPIAAM